MQVSLTLPAACLVLFSCATFAAPALAQYGGPATLSDAELSEQHEAACERSEHYGSQLAQAEEAISIARFNLDQVSTRTFATEPGHPDRVQLRTLYYNFLVHVERAEAAVQSARADAAVFLEFWAEHCEELSAELALREAGRRERGSVSFDRPGTGAGGEPGSSGDLPGPDSITASFERVRSALDHDWKPGFSYREACPEEIDTWESCTPWSEIGSDVLYADEGVPEMPQELARDPLPAAIDTDPSKPITYYDPGPEAETIRSPDGPQPDVVIGPTD
jgi:hypothetical protein